jgi:hypothetical protein
VGSPPVYLRVTQFLAIQSDALAVKTTPHFGQRTWVEVMRRTSAGGI